MPGWKGDRTKAHKDERHSSRKKPEPKAQRQSQIAPKNQLTAMEVLFMLSFRSRVLGIKYSCIACKTVIGRIRSPTFSKLNLLCAGHQYI